MARRNSGFELLLTLPWWVTTILGACVYVGLKFILPTIEFQTVAFNSLGKALAGLAGPIAAIFLVAAAGSFFLQLRKARLVDSQTSTDSISSLSWKDFEFLLSEAFRRQDYVVEENLKGGADGGVDLVLKRDREVTFVQCKNWRTSNVGVTVVRELFGVVKAKGAHKGIVVCSGSYTKEAREFAEQCGIHLIDGTELADMIAGVQRTARMQAPRSPSCPSCGSPMIKRTGRKGKNSGTEFWGCSTYPRCKGTR